MLVLVRQNQSLRSLALPLVCLLKTQQAVNPDQIGMAQKGDIIAPQFNVCALLLSEPTPPTAQELNDFLKSVERRAFKRAVYTVRDEDAALDIVQDAMIRLANSYSDRPTTEWPMLFQRILSNAMLDWFRRQKTRKAVFQNMSDLEASIGSDGEGDVDLLEILQIDVPSTEGADGHAQRAEILKILESAIEQLPARQREAFLMRYWEEMDTAETAAAMGCSEGSVKTHCSRAIASLSKNLTAQGISL
jgi:RNA polymerase sigma-70 factor, ECF subfamily